MIKALYKRVARAAGWPQAPLAKAAQHITQFLEREGKTQVACRDWYLSLGIPLRLPVVTDISVSWMQSSHEHAPGWSADIVSRIMRCETHAFAAKRSIFGVWICLCP